MSNLIQNRNTGRTHYPRHDQDVLKGRRDRRGRHRLGQQLPVELVEYPYAKAEVKCPPCKDAR